MSNISYSGYLYKRSNHPHRNVGELQDQKSLYGIDPTRVPELPVMPGVFSSSTIASAADGSSLYQQQSVLDVRSHQHTTATVTPSPTNNILTTEMAESVEPLILHQQSTRSPPRLADQKKTDVKNPLQMGLELGAAFFGIELKKKGHDDDNNEIRSDQLGGINSSLIDTNISDENVVIQPSTTRTARRPIPTNIGSSSNLEQSMSSYHETIHRRQSAPMMLSESPSSSGLFNSNSSSSRHTKRSASP